MTNTVHDMINIETAANNMTSQPILQHYETGQSSPFNSTEIAILTHTVIFFVLSLITMVTDQLYQLKGDQQAVLESPALSLIKRIQDSLSMLPMLLILLLFSKFVS